MNNKKDNYNVLFDSAILCGMLYGFLYFFAYIHEKYFLRIFGIDIEFIEINITNIIINSTPIIFSWISSLAIVYILKKNAKDKMPLLLEKFLLFCMPFLLLIMLCNDNNFQFYIFLSIFNIIIFLIIIKYYQPQTKFITFSKMFYNLCRKPEFYTCIALTFFLNL